jgi:hypothetical protein
MYGIGLLSDSRIMYWGESPYSEENNVQKKNSYNIFSVPIPMKSVNQVK